MVAAARKPKAPALLAAAIWLMVASSRGWPVSTTHSIVGAIAGFGAVSLGMEAVEWAKLGRIVASWVVSPLIAGTTAFVVFSVTRALILDQPDPIERVQRYGPFYAFAIYAWIKGRDWIRVPSLVWSGLMFANVTIILFEETIGPHATPALGLVYLANAPWLLMPVATVWRLWRDFPFSRASSAGSGG